MQFEIYGPYDVPRNGRWVSRSRADKHEFWNVVEEDAESLSDACGCYVFAIRGRAWYVGLAERQSFCDECFSGHKVLQYNEALQSVSGNPSLHFIAKVTPGNRITRHSASSNQNPGNLRVFSSCKTMKLRGRRSTTFRTPILTTSDSRAAAGTCHGADGMS